MQDANSSFERAIHIYGSAEDFSLLKKRERCKDRCRRKMIEQAKKILFVKLKYFSLENFFRVNNQTNQGRL